MESIPYSQLAKGSFLIATPEIDAGIYCRSVILICEHSLSGSFGLIINKPLKIDLPEDLINLKNSQNPYVRIYTGGPVQSNQIMLLHSAELPEKEMFQICPKVYLGGDLTFLQEALANSSGPHIHFFFGYTGWGPGQLEKEFLGGHWFLAPASFTHVFETSPGKVWQSTLRDLGGKYAPFSLIPDDLSLN